MAHLPGANIAPAASRQGAQESAPGQDVYAEAVPTATTVSVPAGSGHTGARKSAEPQTALQQKLLSLLPEDLGVSVVEADRASIRIACRRGGYRGELWLSEGAPPTFSAHGNPLEVAELEHLAEHGLKLPSIDVYPSVPEEGVVTTNVQLGVREFTPLYVSGETPDAPLRAIDDELREGFQKIFGRTLAGDEEQAQQTHQRHWQSYQNLLQMAERAFPAADRRPRVDLHRDGLRATWPDGGLAWVGLDQIAPSTLQRALQIARGMHSSLGEEIQPRVEGSSVFARTDLGEVTVHTTGVAQLEGHFMPWDLERFFEDPSIVEVQLDLARRGTPPGSLLYTGNETQQLSVSGEGPYPLLSDAQRGMVSHLLQTRGFSADRETGRLTWIRATPADPSPGVARQLDRMWSLYEVGTAQMDALNRDRAADDQLRLVVLPGEESFDIAVLSPRGLEAHSRVAVTEGGWLAADGEAGMRDPGPISSEVLNEILDVTNQGIDPRLQPLADGRPQTADIQDPAWLRWVTPAFHREGLAVSLRESLLAEMCFGQALSTRFVPVPTAPDRLEVRARREDATQAFVVEREGESENLVMVGEPIPLAELEALAVRQGLDTVDVLLPRESRIRGSELRAERFNPVESGEKSDVDGERHQRYRKQLRESVTPEVASETRTFWHSHRDLLALMESEPREPRGLGVAVTFGGELQLTYADMTHMAVAPGPFTADTQILSDLLGVRDYLFRERALAPFLQQLEVTLANGVIRIRHPGFGLIISPEDLSVEVSGLPPVAVLKAINRVFPKWTATVNQSSPEPTPAREGDPSVQWPVVLDGQGAYRLIRQPVAGDPRDGNALVQSAQPAILAMILGTQGFAQTGPSRLTRNRGTANQLAERGHSEETNLPRLRLDRFAALHAAGVSILSAQDGSPRLLITPEPDGHFLLSALQEDRVIAQARIEMSQRGELSPPELLGHPRGFAVGWTGAFDQIRLRAQQIPYQVRRVLDLNWERWMVPA